MDKEFITHEQTSSLKELGFEWEQFQNYRTSFSYIKAPLKQQVFRFFRETYGFKSWIQVHINDTFLYEIRPHVLSHYKEGEIYVYPTYEEAENACIDKLIEIAKQQDNG
jgi:hypothetical protein